MVLLTITSAAKSAIDQYCRLKHASTHGYPDNNRCATYCTLNIGGPIEHADLIEISKCLLTTHDVEDAGTLGAAAREWRLDTLLKGANVYYAPPLPKPEPSSEYKALMRKLREDEERRQYERMLDPTLHQQAFRSASSGNKPAVSLGYDGPDEIDEMTFADVNRQMILIINVLVSIICCSVAIWIAARRWSVPQRLGLSMTGSGLVAAAEVAIYMGYISRLQDAKQKEVKAVEKKEVVQTWVIDKSVPAAENSNIRARKGKHR